MDDFVDIWRIFNLAFLKFMIYINNFFFVKHWNYNNQCFVKHFSCNLYEKIYVLEKKNFLFGRILFSRRETFLAKSDPASTILLKYYLLFIFLFFPGRSFKNFRTIHSGIPNSAEIISIRSSSAEFSQLPVWKYPLRPTKMITKTTGGLIILPPPWRVISQQGQNGLFIWLLYSIL